MGRKLITKESMKEKLSYGSGHTTKQQFTKQTNINKLYIFVNNG